MRRSLMAIALVAAGCTSEPPAAPAPASQAKAPATAPAPPSVVEAPPSSPPDAGPPPLAPDTLEQMQALEGAKAALLAGRDGEARRLFLKASDGPVSGAAVSAGLAAAELLEAAGDAAGAEAVYARLRGGPGGLPEVHLAAGRFYERRNEIPKAIEALQAAVQGQPDLLPAYASLGVLLARAGRNDEAATALLQYESRLNDMLRVLRATKTDLDRRMAVVEVLAMVDDERVTKALIEALAAPEPDLRMFAAEALVDDDSPEALEALARAAQAEQHPLAKRVMFEALGRARDRARGSNAPPPAMPKPQR